MHNKKIFILFMLFMLLICFSPVNASENNTDDIQDLISMEEDSIVAGGENYGTFSELSNLIQSKEGQTLYLNKSYHYDNDIDINCSSGIELNSIVIEGNDHVIDGKGQVRIFNIPSEENTVINNLNLINAFSEEKGAAIYCLGNLTCNNVTFSDNHANDGAAIFAGKNYIDGGDEIEVKINNCIFKDSTDFEGALIHAVNYETTVEIKNCLFKNISSKKPILQCLDINLMVSNTVFENLHSATGGGAIGYQNMVSRQKAIKIHNSTFANVTSLKNGGAIYNNGANLTVNHTKFINCSSDYGGAITQIENHLTVSDCTFRDNYAGHGGGALYLSSMGKTTVITSIFENNRLNTADANGGAVYADLSEMLLNNITFINNTKNAVYCYDSKSNITNCIFKNNSEAIHLAFSQLENSEGNIYNDDTIIENDTEYTTIITGSGIRLEIINNTINVTDLPVRFDSRDWGWVTPVKNQGESGACWAFTTCAAIESALLKATGVEYDLSINNMHKAMLKYSKYGNIMMSEGGKETSGIQYAISWFGIFSQDYDTFSDANGKITTPLISPEVIHIHDAIMLPPLEGEEGINNLKWLIIKCGGVFTVMDQDDAPMSPYFNNITNAYYTDEAGTPIHAVTVVGWDDDYPAGNFKITPPGNGAWIVKNSYGTEKFDDGYIYVSYYDAIFSKAYQVGYLIENTENYTKNYQTDLGGEIILKTGANYTYKNNYRSIGKDLISAVGTYFNEKDQEYALEIYVNDVLKSTQNGLAPYKGFHTIKLTDEIPIHPADNFTVLVKTNSVPLLNSSRTHHLPNTSFLNAGDGWKDLSDEHLTASLKVYTKDLPAPKQTKLTASGVTTVYNIKGYLVVKLKDENGNPIEGAKIKISLNGNKYLITDSKGQVKLSVKSLVPKKYSAKITFSGNDFYSKSSATAKVVVKKATPKFVTVKKTYKRTLKTKKFQVVLKNNINKRMKNVKVILKVNKKTYKVKTNSRGKATFKITNLCKRGTFVAVIKYYGSKYYNPVTVKQKIIIKCF